VSAPLVGRAPELRALAEALAEAAAGRPGAVLIGGDAGIGKSRLLAEFLGHAQADGATVLRGTCLDLGDGALPYLPLMEILRSLVRERSAAEVRDLAGPGWPELARLLPSLATGVPHAPPREGSSAQLLDAVLRLVDECAGAAPTIVAVEDLHWVDRSTADLLRFLSRTLVDQRVLVVGTYRIDDSPDLRALLSGLDLPVRRSQLAPLSVPEVRELVTALLGTAAADPGYVDPGYVDEVARRSEGNAFFARELVAAGPMARTEVPIGVRDLVLARLDAAGPRARVVAGVIAAAGRPVTHPLVAAAVGLPHAELLGALRQCVATQLLAVEGGERYAFRHALALDAVYGDLLPGERAAHHQALAEALTALPASALAEPASATAELAHHWDLAGDAPRAFAASVTAASAAMDVFAYAEAQRQYDRALRLWRGVAGTTDVELPLLLSDAADACRWTGDVERAVDLVERALRELGPGAEPVRTAKLHERRGRYLWELGRTDASLSAYAQACAVLAEAPPSKELVWVLGGHATALVQVGRLHEAVARCREALHAAEAVDAAVEAGRARNTLGAALTMVGSPDEGIAELREAVRIADDAGRLEDVVRGHSNLGFALETAGRLEEALEATLQGVRRVRDLGVETTGTAVLLANASSVLTMLGRWDEAEEIADAAPVRGTVGGLDVYRQIVLAEIDVNRGRFAAAESRLAGGGVAARMSEPQFAGLLHALRAEAQLWQREPGAALATVEAGLTTVAESDDEGQVLRLCALGLRAAADLAQRRRAAPDRARFASLPDTGTLRAARERAPANRPAGVVLRELCLVEQARIDGTATAASWTAVARCWDALAQPYPAAYARWRAAEAAVDRGERSAAVDALRVARQAATTLRAVPLLAEIDALARAARLDLGEPAPERSVEAAPFGLTPREREVVGLLCAGLTNRQIARSIFVTERTAGVHVSNIIAKMQVANRGQAAALARRTGLCPDGVP
jgi:DNA-binding CsgD family transcriptional regulator/tetratricopeptide (TPR) repeat protein